jgi:hypothetical protein
MISAQNLAEREHKRLEVRKATYKAILEQLCRKIKAASELGERSLFLTIPPFTIGYPAYEIESTTAYIQRQLDRLGYKVIKVAQGTLGVSWGDTKPKGPVIIDHSVEEESTRNISLPSLANLQKTAAKLRGSSKGSR